MKSAAIRRLGLTVSRISGAQKLFRLRSRGPTVLFYHGVEEHIIDPEVQNLHMSLRVFERQIAFLRNEREVISIDDLYECITNGKSLNCKHVVVTFDDGYKNNLRIVAPLLRAWNLPFTIFVSTRHISERRRFPMYCIRAATLYTKRPCFHLKSIQKSFDLTTHEKRLAAARAITERAKKAPLELVEHITTECMSQLASDEWAELNARFSSDEPMSWEDVVRTTSMGATIGSHCHDHCILHSNQPEREVHLQLAISKAAVETNVADCEYMAYPNGTTSDISGIAYSSAKSAQFRMAFTTIVGEVTQDVDCFLAPRIFAAPEYEEFCYRLNRTDGQNEIYRVARLQCAASRNQPAEGLN